jgi:hypothetical protein
MADEVVRIAMWSGPRNISTAMMRAFENRADAAVTDEPLYGHYLLATGLDHPGRDEVIRAQETDWRKVTATLTGPIPGGKRVWYQKHMTHHLLPEIGRDWLDQLTSCFLIRDPREVLASYVRTRAQPTIDDLGVARQVEIFEHVRARSGAVPPVLDARDVLEDLSPVPAAGRGTSRSARAARRGVRALLPAAPRPSSRGVGAIERRIAFQPSDSLATPDSLLIGLRRFEFDPRHGRGHRRMAEGIGPRALRRGVPRQRRRLCGAAYPERRRFEGAWRLLARPSQEAPGSDRAAPPADGRDG